MVPTEASGMRSATSSKIVRFGSSTSEEYWLK